MQNPSEFKIATLEEDEGKRIVTTLSSEATVNVFNLLHEQPRTPVGIAKELDISIQSIHYHINKLKENGLIEQSGTELSEKNVKMKNFETSYERIIICGQK